MKTNWTNVLVGAAVLATLAYFLYPKVSMNEGFESSPGAILGSVFAGILGVGIVLGIFSMLFQKSPTNV